MWKRLKQRAGSMRASAIGGGTKPIDFAEINSGSKVMMEKLIAALKVYLVRILNFFFFKKIALHHSSCTQRLCQRTLVGLHQVRAQTRCTYVIGRGNQTSRLACTPSPVLKIASLHHERVIFRSFLFFLLFSFLRRLSCTMFNSLPFILVPFSYPCVFKRS